MVLRTSAGEAMRVLSYALGGVVILLALAVHLSGADIGQLLDDGLRVLGGVFIAILATLALVALYCWLRVIRVGVPESERRRWFESGMHAAAGVATLALTYTLLGISLGIGELPGRELSPATVQSVIGDLTARFSMAFVSTIIGLPVSAVLRAMLAIGYAARFDEGN